MSVDKMLNKGNLNFSLKAESLCSLKKQNKRVSAVEVEVGGQVSSITDDR